MIGNGKKNEPIQINADKEMNDIAENFNAVIKRLQNTNKDLREQSVQLMRYAQDLGLSYEKAKEEERLRNKLSRYVGANLVEKLINTKGSEIFENEKKEVTVLFADIRSFTTLSERMAAEEVVLMLNEFFGIMVDIIFKHSGILDKLVGDELMAVFGLLSPENDAPSNAILSALEMQRATGELMKLRRRQGKETFEIGIGINTGIAIIGNIGSENRMDYTVIGDTVNTAARFQQIAKGGEIIIGEKTYHQVQRQFNVQKKGEIKLKNKREAVKCYQVIM